MPNPFDPNHYRQAQRGPSVEDVKAKRAAGLKGVTREAELKARSGNPRVAREGQHMVADQVRADEQTAAGWARFDRTKQAESERAHEAAAKESARLQKEERARQIRYAKAAGVETEVDPETGATDVQRHPDGGLKFEAGQVGDPRVTAKEAPESRAAIMFSPETDAHSGWATAPGQPQTPEVKQVYRNDRGQMIEDDAPTTTDPKTGVKTAKAPDEFGREQEIPVGVDRKARDMAEIDAAEQRIDLGENQLTQQRTVLEPRYKPASEAYADAETEWSKYRDNPKYVETEHGWVVPGATGNDAPVIPGSIALQQWIRARDTAERKFNAAKRALEPLEGQWRSLDEREHALGLERLKIEQRRVATEAGLPFDSLPAESLARASHPSGAIQAEAVDTALAGGAPAEDTWSRLAAELEAANAAPPSQPGEILAGAVAGLQDDVEVEKLERSGRYYLKAGGEGVGVIAFDENRHPSIILDEGAAITPIAAQADGPVPVYMQPSEKRTSYLEEASWAATVTTMATGPVTAREDGSDLPDAGMMLGDGGAEAATGVTTLGPEQDRMAALEEMGALPAQLLQKANAGEISVQTAETLASEIYGTTFKTSEQAFEEWLAIEVPKRTSPWARAAKGKEFSKVERKHKEEARREWLGEQYNANRGKPGVLRSHYQAMMAERAPEDIGPMAALKSAARWTKEGAIQAGISSFAMPVGAVRDAHLAAYGTFDPKARKELNEVLSFRNRSFGNTWHQWTTIPKRWFSAEGKQAKSDLADAASSMRAITDTQFETAGTQPDLEALDAAKDALAERAYQLHQVAPDERWPVTKDDFDVEKDPALREAYMLYIATANPKYWHSLERRMLLNKGERQEAAMHEDLIGDAPMWAAALVGGINADWGELLTEAASWAVGFVGVKAVIGASKAGQALTKTQRMAAAGGRIKQGTTAFEKAMTAYGEWGLVKNNLATKASWAGRLRNTAVQGGKAALPPMFIESLEEGAMAISEPDATRATILNDMGVGALGGLIISGGMAVPMYAGTRMDAKEALRREDRNFASWYNKAFKDTAGFTKLRPEVVALARPLMQAAPYQQTSARLMNAAANVIAIQTSVAETETMSPEISQQLSEAIDEFASAKQEHGIAEFSIIEAVKAANELTDPKARTFFGAAAKVASGAPETLTRQEFKSAAAATTEEGAPYFRENEAGAIEITAEGRADIAAKVPEFGPILHTEESRAVAETTGAKTTTTPENTPTTAPEAQTTPQLLKEAHTKIKELYPKLNLRFGQTKDSHATAGVKAASTIYGGRIFYDLPRFTQTLDTFAPKDRPAAMHAMLRQEIIHLAQFEDVRQRVGTETLDANDFFREYAAIFAVMTPEILNAARATYGALNDGSSWDALIESPVKGETPDEAAERETRGHAKQAAETVRMFVEAVADGKTNELVDSMLKYPDKTLIQKLTDIVKVLLGFVDSNPEIKELVDRLQGILAEWQKSDEATETPDDRDGGDNSEGKTADEATGGTGAETQAERGGGTPSPGRTQPPAGKPVLSGVPAGAPVGEVQVGSGKPNGVRVPVRYKIVEASELKGWVQREVGDDQNRSRNTNKAALAQENDIRANPDPLYLTESPVANTGAPIVDHNPSAVVAGNGRSWAMVMAWEHSPRTMERYQQWLTDNSARLGLTEQLQGKKQPVLIREVAGEYEGGTRQEFVHESNPRQPGMAESVAEEALNDHEALKEVLPNLEWNADGSLSAGSAQRVGMILQSEARGVPQKRDGKFVPRIVSNRTRAAILAGMADKAGVPFGDFAAIMESEEGARVLQSVFRLANHLAELRDELNLAEPLLQALLEIQNGINAVADGTYDNLAQWRNERGQELIGGTDRVGRILTGLITASHEHRKAKKDTPEAQLKGAFGTALTGYFQMAQREAGVRKDSEEQSSFLDPTPWTDAEYLLVQAVRGMGIDLAGYIAKPDLDPTTAKQTTSKSTSKSEPAPEPAPTDADYVPASEAPLNNRIEGAGASMGLPGMGAAELNVEELDQQRKRLASLSNTPTVKVKQDDGSTKTLPKDLNVRSIYLQAEASLVHFQGNKTLMSGPVASTILRYWSKDQRDQITEIHDMFAGGGSWGVVLAGLFPNVKKIRINEFDQLRFERIRLVAERGNEFNDWIDRIVVQNAIKKALEFTRARSKGVSWASLAKNIGIWLAENGETLQPEAIAVLKTMADDKRLLKPFGDTLPPTDELRKKITDYSKAEHGTRADGFHAAYQALRDNGVEIEITQGDAYAAEIPVGKQVMVLMDPPYFATTGYEDATGKSDVVHIPIYRATSEMLHRSAAVGNNVIYTDEAWWMRKKIDEDISNAELAEAHATLRANNQVADTVVVQKPIDSRYETLTIHNSFGSPYKGAIQPGLQDSAGADARDEGGTTDREGSRRDGQPTGDVESQAEEGAGDATGGLELAAAGVTSFGSGVSREADLEGQQRAGVPSGTTVTELRNKNLRKAFIRAIKDGDPVFIDSGAFSELRGVKVNFREVINTYLALAKHQQTPKQLTVVAPDKVGDQAESLKRLLQNAAGLRKLDEANVRVIVPVQNGELTIQQYLERAGMPDAAIALPSNKSAFNRATIREQISQAGVTDVHLLGMSNMNRSAMPLVTALRESGVKNITLDANRIRSKAGSKIVSDPESGEANDMRTNDYQELAADVEFLTPEEQVEYRKIAGIEQWPGEAWGDYVERADEFSRGAVSQMWVLENQGIEGEVRREMRSRAVANALEGESEIDLAPDDQLTLLAAGDTVTPENWAKATLELDALRTLDKRTPEQEQRVIDLEKHVGQLHMFDLDRPSLRTRGKDPDGQLHLWAAAETKPFYSKLAQVVDAKFKGAKATPDQIIAAIDPTKGSGVKAEEIRWTGIAQKVADLADENNGKVPMAELKAWLRTEEATGFSEVELNDNRKAKPVETDGFVDFEGGPKPDRATRFQTVVLPGGQNYREILLTIPDNPIDRSGFGIYIHKGDERGQFIDDPDAGERMVFETYEAADEFAESMNDDAGMDEVYSARKIQQERPTYTSSHFPKVPGYVAHTRLNDRTDAKGKPGTFIEELQSDRHQKARKKGYKNETPTPKRGNLAKLGARANNALRAADLLGFDSLGQARHAVLTHADWASRWDVQDQAQIDKINEWRTAEIAHIQGLTDKQNAIPDAPHRRDWSLAMFKRALRDAVAAGHDWIGWTTGETQSDRNSLSTYVDEVEYTKRSDGYQIRVWPKGETEKPVNKSHLSDSDLEDHVGKEVAEKITKGEGAETPGKDHAGWKVLRGLDLKVDAKGMRKFYDQMVPNSVQKFVKQWGGRVQRSEMPVRITTKSKIVDELEDITNGLVVGAYDLEQDLADEAYTTAENMIAKMNGGMTYPEALAAERIDSEEGAVAYIAGILAGKGIHEQAYTDPEMVPIWRVDITPPMKKEVEDKGLALYAAAGIRAKNADGAALKRARQMWEAAGRKTGDLDLEQKIWQDTGWYLGPDGHWRFEIDDSAATLTTRPGLLGNNLDEILDHKELFRHYPKLRSVRVFSISSRGTILYKGMGRYSGTYHPAQDGVAEWIQLNSGLSDRRLLSTLLHEVQHAIQHSEGFARGASLDISETLQDRAKDDPALAKRLTAAETDPQAKYDLYSSAYGEIEANATQARRTLTADERALRPHAAGTMIPRQDWIVSRYGGTSLSIGPVSNLDMLEALLRSADGLHKRAKERKIETNTYIAIVNKLAGAVADLFEGEKINEKHLIEAFNKGQPDSLSINLMLRAYLTELDVPHNRVIFEFEHGWTGGSSIGDAQEQRRKKESFGDLVAIHVSEEPLYVRGEGTEAMLRGVIGLKNTNPITIKQATRNELKAALGKRGRELLEWAMLKSKTTFVLGDTGAAIENRAAKRQRKKGYEGEYRPGPLTAKWTPEEKRRPLRPLSDHARKLIKDKLDMTPEGFWEAARNGNVDLVNRLAKKDSKERRAMIKAGRAMGPIDLKEPQLKLFEDDAPTIKVKAKRESPAARETKYRDPGPDATFEQATLFAAGDSNATQALKAAAATRMISTQAALKALGTMPSYLHDVAQTITRQRNKLAAGKLTVRDVTKAYLITVGSVGSDARHRSSLRPYFRDAGYNIDDVSSIYEDNRGQIRPEELVSWWLGTQDGWNFLNSVEQGAPRLELINKLLAIRKPYGKDTLTGSSVHGVSRRKYEVVDGKRKLVSDTFETGAQATKGAYNLLNIADFTAAINETKGDAKTIWKTLTKANGIQNAKAGFIGHLLGVGSRVTTDAVQLAFWLTGEHRPTERKTTEKRLSTLRLISENLGNKRVALELHRRITNRMNDLARKVDGAEEIPADVLPHILHHWLWDKVKGTETTHEGMYQAMELAAAAPSPEAWKGNLPKGIRDRIDEWTDEFDLEQISHYAQPGGHYRQLTTEPVAPPSKAPYRPANLLADGTVVWHPKGSTHATTMLEWLEDRGLDIEDFDWRTIVSSGAVGPDGNYYDQGAVGDVDKKEVQSWKDFGEELDLKAAGDTTNEQVDQAIQGLPPIFQKVWAQAMKDPSATPADLAEFFDLTERAVHNIMDQVRARIATASSTKPATPATKNGKFDGGRPDLAFGADPEFVAADQQRNAEGAPVPERVDEIHDRARKRYESDPKGRMDFLREKINAGEPLNYDEMAEAQIAVAQAKLNIADKTPAEQADLVLLIHSFRELRSKQWGLMGKVMQDPHHSPAERAARFIAEGLYTMDPEERKLWKKAPAKVKEEIAKRWSKKANALREKLKAAGYDVDASLKHFQAIREQRERVLAKEPAAKSAFEESIKALGKKHRIIVESILDGRAPTTVSEINDVSVKHVVDVYRKWFKSWFNSTYAAAERIRDLSLGRRVEGMELGAASPDSLEHAIDVIASALGIPTPEEVSKAAREGTAVAEATKPKDAEKIDKEAKKKPAKKKAKEKAAPPDPMKGYGKPKQEWRDGPFPPDAVHQTQTKFGQTTFYRMPDGSWRDMPLKPGETFVPLAIRFPNRLPKIKGFFDVTDPRQQAELIKHFGRIRGTKFDAWVEYWRMSILTGPQTHMVNTGSNLLHLLYDLVPRRVVEAGVNEMFGIVGAKEKESATFSEFAVMTKELRAAASRGARAMLLSWNVEGRVVEEWSAGLPVEVEFTGAKADYIPPVIQNRFGRIMRMFSFRAMTAADEFIKGFHTQLEAAAYSHRIAKHEGLKGQDYQKRFKELMESGSHAWAKAMESGERITFQTPLNPKGEKAIQVFDFLAEAIKKTRRKKFGKGLNLLVPFVDTPLNIFKLAIEYSPLNLAFMTIDGMRALHRSVVRGEKSKEEAALRAKELYDHARIVQDFTNQIIAWATYFTIASLIDPDDDEELPWITGTIPYKTTRRGERDLAYRTMPPQSIRIGKLIFSYKRIEPFATVLASTVDMIAALQANPGDEEAASRLLSSLKEQMKDKTFLSGIGDLINAIEDPDRFLTRIGSNIATGFVPNLVRQPLRESDPWIRNTNPDPDDGVWTALAKRTRYQLIPQTAPVRVDVWGNPVDPKRGGAIGGPATDTVVRIIDPTNATWGANLDPIDRYIANWNHNHATPDQKLYVEPIRPTTWRKVGTKRIRIGFTVAEQNQMNTWAGKQARSKLGNDWPYTKPTAGGIQRIRATLRAYQTAARDKMVAQKMPALLAEIQREADAPILSGQR